MRPIAERAIRSCFVNCSKGEAQRAGLPKGLADQPWADLDFLGWRDPGAPDRGYLVVDRDGGPLGVALRATTGGGPRVFTARGMCSLCLTTHQGGGVALMAARRAGAAGRQGNTVGEYLCADLGCPLYLRGLRKAAPGGDLDESLGLDAKIARMLDNLDGFLDKVTR